MCAPKMLAGTPPAAIAKPVRTRMRRSIAYEIDAVAFVTTTSARDVPATIAGGNPKNNRNAGTRRNPPPSPTTDPAKLVMRPTTSNQTPVTGGAPAGYLAVTLAKKCTVRQLAHTCLYADAVNSTRMVA
jgi:hypothetical protein